MAKKSGAQPLGQVALGQEGSGLAQIFRPHDAGKYDAQIIAQKERAKKEQLAQDKVKRKSALKPDSQDFVDPWEIDQESYAVEYKDLRQKQEQLYSDYANLQFLSGDALDDAIYNYTKSQASLNTEEANLNDRLFVSGQQKALSVESRKVYDQNKGKYSERTDANIKNYNNPPQAFLDKYDSVEEARRHYSEEVLGGSLLEEKLVQDKFSKALQGLQVAQITASGTSWVNDDFSVSHSTEKAKEYSDEQQKEVVLNNYSDNQLALRDLTYESHDLYDELKAFYRTDKPEFLTLSEIYDFVEPIFSASSSCVSPFLSLAS